MVAILQKDNGSQDRIKASAVRFLILNGFLGLRIGDVADELGITRANIHYHFGSKDNLVDAVIEDYMRELLERYHSIWASITTSYRQKVEATIEFNKGRFRQFHGGTLVGSNPWSLIGRLRNDAAFISQKSRSELARLEIVDAYIAGAVRLAQLSGEISVEAPTDAITKQLIVIIDCASEITQIRGGFEPLQSIYRAHVELVMDAYGKSKSE